jgi:hypothetical protein
MEVSGKKKTHCSGKELLKEIRRSQTLQSKKSAFTSKLFIKQG